MDDSCQSIIMFFLLEIYRRNAAFIHRTQPVLLLRKPVFSQSLQGFCIVVSGECRYE